MLVVARVSATYQSFRVMLAACTMTAWSNSRPLTRSVLPMLRRANFRPVWRMWFCTSQIASGRLSVLASTLDLERRAHGKEHLLAKKLRPRPLLHCVKEGEGGFVGAGLDDRVGNREQVAESGLALVAAFNACQNGAFEVGLFCSCHAFAGEREYRLESIDPGRFLDCLSCRVEILAADRFNI